VRVELANSNSAQFTVEELELGVDCAYEPDENWRWSAGLLWTHSSSAVDIGDADLGSDSEQTGGLLLAAEYDSLDDTAFPRDGSTLSWTSFLPLADLGNADDELLQFSYDRVEAVAGGSLVLGAELDTVLESGASVQNFFPLGGFLRLSGLGSDAISGPTAALARAVYFRQLGATRAQREDFTWYAGASLEAGNVFADLSDLELGELRLASSAFLGLYAGVGLTEGGSTSLFVVLGRVF
jgi:NTE family protein